MDRQRVRQTNRVRHTVHTESETHADKQKVRHMDRQRVRQIEILR